MSEDRSVLQTSALAGALLAVLGVAVVAGLVLADDTPSGEAVLTSIEERYESADSIVVDATVTVEKPEAEAEFDVVTVVAERGRMRTNVSAGGEYAVVATTGNTSWIESSASETPLVVRNDTVVARPSFGLGLKVSDRDAIVANVTEPKGALPENDSVSNLTQANGSLLERYSVDNRTGLTEALPGNYSVGDLAEITESVRGAHDAEHAPFGWENASVSTVLEETNATAEFVETTTVGEQEVNVVRVTRPGSDADLTVWATADTAELLEYRVRSRNTTVTVDVAETHFDVEPAESTFQPPTEDRSATAESIEELRTTVDRPLAVPSPRWSFERGRIVGGPVSGVASVYADDASTLTIVQSRADELSAVLDDGRAVNVGERNVTVARPRNDTTVAGWSEANETVVVAADLPESDLLEVVEAIEFAPAGD